MRNMKNMRNRRNKKIVRDIDIDEEEVKVLINDLLVFAEEIEGVAYDLENALNENNELDIIHFKLYGHDIIEVLRHVVIF